MRRDMLDEMRDAYHDEESPQDLKDWIFDKVCDDDERLDRDFDKMFEICERWERCVYPLTVIALALAAVSVVLLLTAR